MLLASDRTKSKVSELELLLAPTFSFEVVLKLLLTTIDHLNYLHSNLN